MSIGAQENTKQTQHMFVFTTKLLPPGNNDNEKWLPQYLNCRRPLTEFEEAVNLALCASTPAQQKIVNVILFL